MEFTRDLNKLCHLCVVNRIDSGKVKKQDPRLLSLKASFVAADSTEKKQAKGEYTDYKRT